eukprot:CAMPEP_0173148008 /NCGR_PEP_ID=MMETSP1105-20130129/9461_1 /TAXON_ID=2985 /ORGANISM="Ochromonas sp., Strain BG-1" /LENGTH=429 /DNA_ID=CAMNT_0014062575 /DNA_START=758 /DNA_END=2047 /DNA_ORIENTATION=-
MGNILPSSKREGFYYHRMQNYGSTDLTDDELDYESLLREVPSRQGSFFKSKNSERIPIKVGSLAEGGEGVIPSSFSRAQSWLSEPSRPTSLDAKSGSVGKEGISLLTHYKKFRQRGFSAGSDASSVEGATPLTVNTAVDHKRLAHIPAGKKSVGQPSGKSSRRKIRYYDEKNSVQSNLSHLTTQSLTENESDGSSGRNTANIMKLSGEDDDHEENDEEDEMIVDTTHVPSYGTQISTDMGKQYELMVEPQSPSPPSSYIQESEYLSQRKESFHGIDMIRISSYEATGGDHVHGNHVLLASGTQTPPALLNAHQREPSYYLEENSPALLSYHHNRNDGAKERKQDIASLALNPVYPRPTRHHPNSNPFHPMAVNSKNYDRSSTELSSSFSPSLMERTRSVDNTSTPDRDEAAKEATMLRQGMTGNRYSPR